MWNVTNIPVYANKEKKKLKKISHWAVIIESKRNFVLQIQIEARDRGTPARRNLATFVLTINFNLNPPVISPQTCVRDIYETDRDANDFSYTIGASDGDANNAGVRYQGGLSIHAISCELKSVRLVKLLGEIS